MIKKIFTSLILLIAIMCFVLSLLKGNNNSDKAVVKGPDRVAVIDIEGPITSGSDSLSSASLWSKSAGVTSGSIMRQLRRAAGDDSVKAVLLRINSPGGSATAAEEVGRELKRFKESTKKPVVASMGDSATSAAYWIAACGDKVYANASSLTGSIGAYVPYTNLQEVLKKIGIASDRIKSGPYKDILAADRPMTPEERQLIQNIVDEIYGDFVTAVAEGRKMDEAQVRRLADGRIYTGRQAKTLGLVDELGNYYDALQEAGKLGQIKPKADGLPEVLEDEKPQPWEYLLGAEMTRLFKGAVAAGLNSGLGLEQPGTAQVR